MDERTLRAGPDADADMHSGYLSLKALARASAAMGCAVLAGLWITGNAVVQLLLPWILSAAAIALALSVWAVDARPRAQWRGLGASAILVAVAVMVRAAGILG